PGDHQRGALVRRAQRAGGERKGARIGGHGRHPRSLRSAVWRAAGRGRCDCERHDARGVFGAAGRGDGAQGQDGAGRASGRARRRKAGRGAESLRGKRAVHPRDQRRNRDWRRCGRGRVEGQGRYLGATV
ncbi:hypothetical protein LPJ70_004713, partial [Coemansia sp. RSA 2708]